MIQNLKDKLIDEIFNAIQKTGLLKPTEKQKLLVTYPPKSEYGDYATNIAIILANKMKQNPTIVSQNIINKLKKRKFITKIFSEINEINGFINFVISRNYILKNILPKIIKKNFYIQNIGAKKKIIIDYSSPNIAKPMHVGHLRSTILGQTIYNLFKAIGYKSIGINHIGDWGTQFGAVISAIKLWAPKEKLSIEKLFELYVKFNKEKETNLQLEEIAREEFRKLENNNKENIKIWKTCREISLKEFKKIYNILNIQFDFITGESFYKNKTKEVLKDALNKKIGIRQNDNTIIIPLEKFGMIPFLIQKSDGSTLYSTRDLAAIKYRVKKFKPEKIIYIIGSEQAFYLKQLFKVSDLLGYFPEKNFNHINFGLYLFEGRKMASRKGETIKLEELIEEVINFTKKIIQEKNKSQMNEKEFNNIAKIIALGALKYNDLSQNRLTNINFNLEKMCNLEGESGPYIQYACVRLNNILNKIGKVKKTKINFTEELEWQIIKQLIKFPEIIKDSALNFQINLLTKYLYELAGLINNFYEKFPVIKADNNKKYSRFILIKTTLNILKSGLNLLGIEIPNKM